MSPNHPILLFLAYDVGPCNALQKIAETFPGSICFFGNGGKTAMPSEREIYDAMGKCDAVVVGISSTLQTAKLELFAATAASDIGMPLAIFADTFGTLKRSSWGREICEHADYGLVISPAEVEEMRGLMPHATIVAVGNPVWENYFLPASRDAVRKRMDWAPEDRVALVPGIKNPVLNSVMLMAVAEALEKVGLEMPGTTLRLVFAPHPGEKKIQSPEVYGMVREYYPGIVITILEEEVKTDDVLPGVDVVIDLGNSSAGIHAIARRLPLIALEIWRSREYLQRTIGQPKSIAVQHGAALFESPTGLAHALDSIFDRQDHLWLKMEAGAQARFLPPPAQVGATVAKIAVVLRKMVEVAAAVP